MKKKVYCPHCTEEVKPSDQKVGNKHGIFHEACWQTVRELQEQNEALAHDGGIWRN